MAPGRRAHLAGLRGGQCGGQRSGRRGTSILAITVLGLLAALASALTSAPARAAEGGPADSPVPELLGRDPGVVYLTFDDGPDQLFTPILLDLLDAHGARATFFLLGRNLAARWGSDEVQDLLNRGHAVGNHSTYHRMLSEQHPWRMAADLEEASVLLEDLTGYRPSCWRAPYGDRNAEVDLVAEALGMTHVGWTADPQEWRDPWVPVVVDYLTRERHDGSVILLHDRKWLSLHIVDDLLPAFHEEGWRFDALPTCRAPGERAQRMATRGVDETPVGRVEGVTVVDGGLEITGWAYDADAPDGGLEIVVNAGTRGPETLTRTDPGHDFTIRLDGTPADPICILVIDAGRRQDAALGCHRPAIPPVG